FCLAVREDHHLGLNGVLVEPRRRGVGADDRDAIAVLEELAQPRNMAVTTAEGRIHPYPALPGLPQSVIRLRVDLARRHPMSRTWRTWVQGELQAKRIKGLAWGAPLRCRADARFVSGHGRLLRHRGAGRPRARSDRR